MSKAAALKERFLVTLSKTRVTFWDGPTLAHVNYKLKFATEKRTRNAWGGRRVTGIPAKQSGEKRAQRSAPLAGQDY